MGVQLTYSVDGSHVPFNTYLMDGKHFNDVLLGHFDTFPTYRDHTLRGVNATGTLGKPERSWLAVSDCVVLRRAPATRIHGESGLLPPPSQSNRNLHTSVHPDMANLCF